MPAGTLLNEPLAYEVITRDEATKNGQLFYYTGKPCRNGHVDLRYVKGSGCKTCKNKNTAAHYESNKEQKLMRDRERQADYPEKRASAKRKWYQKNVERIKDNTRNRRYKLLPGQFQIMLAAQNNSCGVCETTFTSTPHVDHCHTTGVVRKLLCGKCNKALGLVNDNAETLKKLSDYVIYYAQEYEHASRKTA